MTANKCCVPNCNKTRTDDLILHVFPEPDRESERFDSWLEVTKGALSHLTRQFIFRNRRICHLHFEKQYFTRSRRLAANAIPTLNLQDDSRNSLLENKDVDDQMLDFRPGADDNISLKTTHENTHSDTTPKEKCTSFRADPSSSGNRVDEKHTLLYHQDEELMKRDRNIFWKKKLVSILNNTQFCGVCLEVDVDTNALTDVFEITDDERTYSRSLRDIVHKVFKETGRIASSKICNNCTNKLIQSYIFIHNAEETSEMLNYYLSDLFSKTCYIHKNILKDSMTGERKIHNAVISLDNKDISENMHSSKRSTKNHPETNNIHFKRHRRILRCLSCNMDLPSYRVWRTHERTAHKHSHRCRICLQSYKTQRALTIHYETHLNSRCAFSTTDINRHISASEKVTKIYECQYCKKQFFYMVLLHKHENCCRFFERRYQHSDCSMDSNLSKFETKVRKFKRGAYMYPCSLCQRIFLNEVKRRKHMQQAHSKRKKKMATKLECLVCQTKFVSKAAFILHLKYHRAHTKYSCKGSKVGFENLREFKDHNREHTLSFTVCEVCGKRIHKFGLKKHLGNHSKSKTITQVH